MSKPKNPIEIIARGVLRRGDEVLLCRNRALGYSYLPGGHVEFGERASAALSREFDEECGLAVRATEFAAVVECVFETQRRRHHEINLVFHVEHCSGDPPTAVVSREPEIEFVWARPSVVVGMDIRPAAIKSWLLAFGTPVGDPEGVWRSDISSAPLSE